MVFPSFLQQTAAGGDSAGVISRKVVHVWNFISTIEYVKRGVQKMENISKICPIRSLCHWYSTINEVCTTTNNCSFSGCITVFWFLRQVRRDKGFFIC